jgi:NitT/TauT family transport system ATP-binding protein
MGLRDSGALLTFSHVSKIYSGNKNRDVHAVQDICFSIVPSEFVAFIGPTGCGKSTILRLAAGLDLPTQGDVLYAGKSVIGPSPERGLVFQAYNAFPWLTVRENVAFGLALRDGTETQIEKWLGYMGLTDFADVYPKTLSGGMRQRVAIARSMIVRPSLLLLDEPFGALDERTRAHMQQLLLRIVHETLCTVVLVSHDIREAILLSDRVIMLEPRPGRISREFVSDLPKPRSREQMKTPAFNELYDYILESFPA